jgi:hypothetical protein
LPRLTPPRSHEWIRKGAASILVDTRMAKAGLRPASTIANKSPHKIMPAEERRKERRLSFACAIQGPKINAGEVKGGGGEPATGVGQSQGARGAGCTSLSLY